mmetsp:Transcript_4667/g.9863  ORF Transcript_4667/g.9863 Transcript_4667/m.9863 type:complete len:282 (-) Transcript_4667:279-1124(-)
MSQGRDGLHLDGVAFFEGMIEDAGGVDDLPPEVAMIAVSDVEGFGSEGVRLHLDVGPRDLVQKGRFADVGEAAKEEGTSRRVQGRETTHVLPDFLEVREGRLLPLQHRAHPTQRRPLEALAPVQGISVLDHAYHIAGYGIAKTLGRVDLTERQLVVIAVVEDVAEVGVEGVDVGEAGGVLEDLGEAFVDGLLGELDLAHVERSDPRDLVPRMNHRGRPTLRPRQHHVHHLRRGRDGTHLLEVVNGHGCERKRLARGGLPLVPSFFCIASFGSGRVGSGPVG